jgi:putative transcriptional regulator
VSDSITGFVRLAEGAVFPEHEHLGTEHILVLHGRWQDGDAIYGPGDYVEMSAGTSHSFNVCSGPDLLYLAVLHKGLRIDGIVIGPDDPRA